MQITEEQRDEFRAQRAASESAKAEREAKSRALTEAALREPVERQAARLKELEAKAAKGAAWRAKRAEEIRSVLAEHELITQASEDPKLRLGKNPEVETYAASLRFELRALEGIGETLADRVRKMTDMAIAPVVRRLSNELTSPDDVMVFFGPDIGMGPLWIEDGVAVHAGRTAFIPPSEWPAVKAQLDARRERRFEIARGQMYEFYTTPTSEGHVAALESAREQVTARWLATYEQRQVFIVEGDERWNPVGLMRRLSGFVSPDPFVLDEQVGRWALNTTTSMRVLVRWHQSLIASGHPGQWLGHRLVDAGRRVDTPMTPMAAIAWWESHGVSQ